MSLRGKELQPKAVSSLVGRFPVFLFPLSIFYPFALLKNKRATPGLRVSLQQTVEMIRGDKLAFERQLSDTTRSAKGKPLLCGVRRQPV